MVEYSREGHTKSPNAPRRRVHHPRCPRFAFFLAAVLVWLVFRAWGQ